MEQYNSIQQLMKKEQGSDKRIPLSPVTYFQSVFNGKTGASLEAVLAQFNSIYIQYQGTPEATRNVIPEAMRRAGLMITYMNMDSETITERASSAAQKDNGHWGLDVNWSRVDELSLSGDIAVSAKGTWIINGEDTGIKAVGPKGDSGITPWLKTIGNKLHFSYDNVIWEPCSEDIAAWFRFSATSSSSQAGTVGRIQISRDNKTWTDLSPDFTNNLRISGYVATTSALPGGKAVGTIFGVGPTYASEDTAHTNPIYALHVWDGTKWVNNGNFTSIAAGIVQETGDSETEVMSQKAVTEKLSELGQQVIYDVSANNDGATFASFSALLSSENLSTLIPTAVRCGGMNIRFVQSSDNKYVQYRYVDTSTYFANFTNEANWQGVEDVPTAGSENLIKSSGVATSLMNVMFVDTIIRQGTFTNPSNLTTVTTTFVIPFGDIDTIEIRTNRPIEEGYEYRFGFATYQEKTGRCQNLTSIRRVNSQEENYVTKQNGENSCAFCILKYKVSDGTYSELLLSDFEGYYVQVRRKSDDIYNNIKRELNSIDALSQIRGKRISIIGDSISSYTGYCVTSPYYPTVNPPADVNDISDMWWYKIMLATNAELGVNSSWGGARVTNTRPSPPADSFYDRVDDIGANGTPDVIFVELGTNDSFGNVQLGEYDYDAEMSSYDESLFVPAYIKGVRGLLTAYPNSKIILISLAMAQVYQEAIANIAAHYNITHINIQNYTTCSDGYAVHPDNAGMNLIAERLMKYKIYQSIEQLEENAKKSVLSFQDNFVNLSSKMIDGDLPLFSPVNGFLKDPSIWFYNGKWYMYCTTSTEGTTNFDTDWYSSADGKTWKYERRVFEHTGVNGYAKHCKAATSKAVLIDGVWHIWVTCWGTTNGWCIAHYTCTDIENPEWAADENNPIVTNANNHVLDPFIVLEDGTYYMFYTHDTTEQIAYRTSEDGITWSNETDIANVFGEGPMVMKAANGKWLIMCAHAGGQSLQNEDIDVFESDSLTSGYSYIGKPNMQLPSWANVCYGHGDLLEIPAGYFGYPKKKYLLYYQATWNFGANMVIGTAMSDDGYHWYPYNFGKYGWGDFFEIDNLGYMIIRKQNTLPNWKPFVRTYDYWRDFEISVKVTQLTTSKSKAAGLVFFGENAQYLNCLVVEFDIANQLMVAKLLPKNNVGDAITYLSLPITIGVGGHLLLKVERKGTTIGVSAFDADTQLGAAHFKFDVPGFERLAFGLISENSEAYFNELNLVNGTK